MAKGKINLRVSETGECAYLYLREHPGKGTVGASVKQVRLIDLYPGYNGADIVFDFDQNNQLIGIEVVS